MKIGNERFTIYEVEDIYKTIVLEIDGAQELEIDFQGVQKMDTAAIQLLLSTQKTCQKDNKKLKLTNISPELQRTISQIGCISLLGEAHE